VRAKVREYDRAKVPVRRPQPYCNVNGTVTVITSGTGSPIEPRRREQTPPDGLEGGIAQEWHRPKHSQLLHGSVGSNHRLENHRTFDA
jgi:hypothetical protein